MEWAAEVIPLRLADAFLKAVEAGTEESPLVLVVDDIHAADNASAAILHVIARKLPHTRLLLILTARSNELRTVAAPSALASDSSIEAMQTLEVEPLPGAAAGQLVAALVEKAQRQIAVCLRLLRIDYLVRSFADASAAPHAGVRPPSMMRKLSSGSDSRP